MTASERIRAARKQREIRVAQADMRRDAAARAWATRKPLMERAGVYTEPTTSGKAI